MALASRLSLRLLVAAAALVAVAALAVLVLTQTQVGRDGVARQVEAQFERQFEGTIEIGRLTGNLLWDLHGSGVVVRDGAGREVVAADSMVIQPRWRSLLSNRLELKRITLIRPRLDLVHEDGEWNLGTAFRSRRPVRDDAGRPIDLSFARVVLVDGTISTRRTGEAPTLVADGHVFDYTNTRATRLNAALDLRFDHRRRLVRVRSLSADLPDQAISLHGARARLTLGNELFALDGVSLRIGESHLSGSLRKSRRGTVNVSLNPSLLVSRDIRVLLPAYPLEGRVSVAARADGPTDALRVRRVDLRAGESAIALSGVLSGWPDRLDYEFEASTNGLKGDDLIAIRPDLADEARRIDGTSGTIKGHGSLPRDGRFDLIADVDLTARPTALRGRVELHSDRAQMLQYSADMAVRNLNPARYHDDAPTGSVTGRVRLDGRGLAPGEQQARVRIDMAQSVIADRAVAGLLADVSLAGGRLRGSAELATEGRLAISGSADLRNGQYDLDLDLDEFDLASLWLEGPTTSLTGLASVNATGSSTDDLNADVRVRLVGSTATVADSTWHLPDDLLAVEARPASGENPRLRLLTDAVEIEADGAFSWPDLVSVATFWGDRMATATRRDLLPSSNGLETAARRVSDATVVPVGDQKVELAIIAHRSNALRPWVHELAPGSRIGLRATASTDSLDMDLSIDTDRMQIGSVVLVGAQTRLHLDGGPGDDPLSNLAFTLAGRSDTLRIGSGGPLHPDLSARFDPASRSLVLETTARRSSDGLLVSAEADIAVLADRYRLAGAFALDAPGEKWRVDGADVDLYTDAIHFRDFDAARVWPENGRQPHLRLSGTASARATDTLSVAASALDLDEVFQLLALELPFDGLADADLLVTSALGSPAILGAASVEGFTVWGDPAGQVHARSEIIAGQDGFYVDVRVTPESDTAAIQNRGRLAGTLRFPGRAPGGGRDPGYLDLAASFERLDLFILNHLFPEIIAGTTGGAAGRGTITGDWSFPIFDADLAVTDAHTRVPDFNLAFGASGGVAVDRRGIHVRDVRLRDKAGGTGVVDGSILFNEYRYFSFDLRGVLSEFEVIDVGRAEAGTLPFYGHIRASGSAQLTGPIQNAFLRSPDAVTTADSRLFIPVTAGGPAGDAGFLLFADADGTIPEREIRTSLIADRPDTERPFLDGLSMLLNVNAPSGSTVHLVFDPLVGDVINAVGSGRLQLAIREGQFETFGTFEVERGDYLFTAGDVFTRRFELERGGVLEWDGDPIDARLELPASYRTRASVAGLGLAGVDERQRVPLVVRLDVSGRVRGPLVDLSLELDDAAGRQIAAAEPLRLRLNEPDRQAEYATSVLLTNTFLLAPSDRPGAIAEAADELFYTSLSELVSTRLNLFLNQALGADNLDVALGLQQRAGLQDVDFTYGVALRLLDERLVIRGEGVYLQLDEGSVADALQGEVAVEARLSSAVSVQLFYRRESDPLIDTGAAATAAYGAYGAGVNYQAEFTNWRSLVRRLFSGPSRQTEDSEAETVTASGG